ncbi:PTS fructose transporter subunit IIC [Jeotgalibaca caeni]|uniref:PTS fructose transporter subunit IIC n=1 Tax=Jeotgalibaca caeni TaxID=3028623 RepID=UPI00237E182B|nr:fructose-specific PTS transporter subunit EIIC [Jeotgalibaca caeni]MDE1549309.1 fructose-specific PTS transporter subunit EIIC [Jeotgalibaca caeni]
MNGKKIYQHLMTGVSYFLPFVIGGGIITALAFLLDVGNSSSSTFGSSTPLTAWLLQIGGLAMGMMFPFLAGYVAYSIGDKPAILLGIVTGMLARDGGSGFLGAIAAGFISGYIIVLLKKLTQKFPRSLEGIKSLLIFPIVGLLLSAAAMILVNMIVAPINTGLNNFLVSLNDTSAVLIGAVIGVMLALDLGGPINKTAYLFAVATLTNASGEPVPSVIMAACGSSAMVISTSCAVAATLFPKKFSPSLRAAKVGAYIMGLAFFVEGAIPYVIAKPKKILPALCIGAAVTGGLTAAMGITLAAPIGGLETLPLVSNIPLYLLSFVVGTAVAVLIIYLLTRNDEEYEIEKSED